MKSITITALVFFFTLQSYAQNDLSKNLDIFLNNYTNSTEIFLPELAYQDTAYQEDILTGEFVAVLAPSQYIIIKNGDYSIEGNKIVAPFIYKFYDFLNDSFIDKDITITFIESTTEVGSFNIEQIIENKTKAWLKKNNSWVRP